MTTPEDAIRARRKLTNRLIAAHDAGRMRPFFTTDVKLIVGDGTLIIGVDSVIEAFAGQFRDPAFHTYVRHTVTVAFDSVGGRAAEAGRWTAHWTGVEMAGPYLAVWRKVTGQWQIESELYVTL